MNKAVIFDLDGTLIDSLPDIAINLNLALQKFGYPKRELSDFKRFIGNGARRLVNDSIGGNVAQDQLDRCLKYYNELYTASGSPNTALFEGVGELIIRLKESGFKLAILTNKPQITTDDVYKNYLAKYRFDLVVGQSDKFKCKPDKASAQYVLDTLNCDKDASYFVGDGETDVQTAINAQIKGIAVLWGYRTKEQLSQAGAKLFANKPSDILSMLGI